MRRADSKAALRCENLLGAPCALMSASAIVALQEEKLVIAILDGVFGQFTLQHAIGAMVLQSNANGG